MAERKGKKLRRATPKSKARYAVQFGITEKNKKKKVMKHLRGNPDDHMAIVAYEKTFGKAQPVLNRKGRYLTNKPFKRVAARPQPVG